MTGLDFFTQITWKATVVLCAAFGASWMLRRRAASLRHFLWTAILAALLLLPALWIAVPHWGWRLPVQQKLTVVGRRGGVRVRMTPAAPVTRAFSYWLIVLWGAGFSIAAVRFAAGSIRTAGMVRRAIPAANAGSGGNVPVLESTEIPMPLAWGIWRPAVVLPAGSRDWPPARLRTVLLHEVTHVERRDLLAQALGQAVCCLYWFHPLAWMAARELRKERERACDDAVLLGGVPAHDYADDLVALVRAMSARQSQWPAAVGMAERSDLEMRVRALLDRGRERRPLSRRAAAAMGAAALVVLMPLATLSSYGQATRAGLHGVVQDPSGARVTGCEVTAKNLDGSNQEVAHCDMAGAYRFNSIPAGRYEVQFGQVRGFKNLKLTVPVAAGVDSQLDANLEIGTVTSVVTVTGGQPKSNVRANAAPAQRIRIGGMVQAAQLVTQQRPVYPADAEAQGVTGTVMIQAVISKTGDVLGPRVTNTDVDSRLAKAALDAVSQWHYTPTLLNGEPVEVVTSIQVSFGPDQ
jgi:TonB family protein